MFRRLVERYPASRYAERAYWRSGWWDYRARRYDEAARLFDQGIARFPRADFRPSWLYWSGRSWKALGDVTRADDRLRVAAIDYANSYYGRLARTELSAASARGLRTASLGEGMLRTETAAIAAVVMATSGRGEV